jgi:hypothetical protein
MLDSELTQIWIDGFERDWSHFEFDSP